MASKSLIRNQARQLAGASLLAALVLIAGCGKGPQRAPLYPVEGQLFVKGQPAGGAHVILHPVEDVDPDHWPRGYPNGRVQQDGKFQIELYDANDGAPAGKYKLLAQWKTGEEGQEEDAEAPPRQDKIEPSYFNPTLSPWSVTIEPKSNRLPRFDVP